MRILEVCTLIVLVVTLSGCPATMYAHLKNETEQTVRYVYGTGNSDIIKPGKTEKVLWKQGCITLQIEGTSYQYQAEYPNGNYIKVSIFSTSIAGRITEDRQIEIENDAQTILKSCKSAT